MVYEANQPLRLLMSNALSTEFIQELLKKDAPRESLQTGPIRFFDKEMRCASRGCSSPTYIKIEGIPLCMMHTILRANEMLT